MQIEFLGSGGAITTPRPGCACRLCVEAQAKGVPYSRGGPSVFVHGPNVLIDTPEEIKAEFCSRSRVTQIDAALYSHWHPGSRRRAARLGDDEQRLAELARPSSPHRHLPAAAGRAGLPATGWARGSSSCTCSASAWCATSLADGASVELNGVRILPLPAGRRLRVPSLRDRRRAFSSRRTSVRLGPAPRRARRGSGRDPQACRSSTRSPASGSSPPITRCSSPKRPSGRRWTSCARWTPGG